MGSSSYKNVSDHEKNENERTQIRRGKFIINLFFVDAEIITVPIN